MIRRLVLTVLLSWCGMGAMTARAEAECGSVTKENRIQLGCEKACSLLDDFTKPTEEIKNAREKCVQDCSKCYPPDPPKLYNEPKIWAGGGIGVVGIASIIAGSLLLRNHEDYFVDGNCPLIGLATSGCQLNRWPGGLLLGGGISLTVSAVPLIVFGLLDYDRSKKKSR